MKGIRSMNTLGELNSKIKKFSVLQQVICLIVTVILKDAAHQNDNKSLLATSQKTLLLYYIDHSVITVWERGCCLF
jgi:hypothetical protein